MRARAEDNMAISDNIRAKMGLIAQENAETEGESETGKDIATKAIAAIHKGAGSTEWKTYMELFAAGNAADLARLIPTDGSENDTAKREARAYLVGNGVCGPGTTTGLLNTVFKKLDV